MSIIDWLNGIRKKPAAIPLYCRKCGNEILTQRDGDDFDPQTGEPRRYLVTAHCPNLDYDNCHYLKRWVEG